MKVLALVDDPGGACYRYRWNAYAWALAEAGFNLDVVAWGKSWQRLQALVAAARADIVILQRRLLPRWQLAMLRRVTRTLIYDFDDALFRRDSYCGKAQHNKNRIWPDFPATLRAADGMIAGNDYLRQVCGNANRSSAGALCTNMRAARLVSYGRTSQFWRGGEVRLDWSAQRLSLRCRPHKNIVARGRKSIGCACN